MEVRIEKDSMGEIAVPFNALYGAQTQRAVENFQVSGMRFPRIFIRALGLIKAACAEVNMELGRLDKPIAEAIIRAAQEVAAGQWDDQFVVDVFQTGSGTSTNMNANEVIANRASQLLDPIERIHPNDHVNMGQSSNDVIPTAIHVSAYLAVQESLIPSLKHLHKFLNKKAITFDNVIKTGRTHLMDAMPIRLGQEFSGYARQVALGMERIEAVLPRLAELTIGGTAVGTGVCAPPGFGPRVVASLNQMTGLPFRSTRNHFAAQAAQDTAVELSGHLRTLAVSLMKIANDLRWMNSGPNAGLGEITLPALQPGSSMMPGKVNPVIPESVMMVCAQVMGNDVVVTIAGQAGNFELNTMLPLIAHNLLQSLQLLSSAARLLADRAIAGMDVHREHVEALLERNPILATALAMHIGYDKAAEIAKRAQAEQRSVLSVAKEMTNLTEVDLKQLLTPKKLTEPGTGLENG